MDRKSKSVLPAVAQSVHVTIRKNLIGLSIITFSALLLFREVLLSTGLPPGIDALGYIAGVANLSRHFRMLYLWGHGSFGAPYEFTFRLPLALLNLLLNNAALTMNLFCLFSFLLAGFSMYFLVYRLTGSRVASTSSAILFTVNQFFIAKWANGHYHQGYAYAVTPLLFLTLDSALKSRKLKWIVAFSLSYSSLFLTRYDPLLYITGFLLLYALFVLIKPHPETTRRSSLKHTTAVWILSIAIVTVFSAFIILPSLRGLFLAEGLKTKIPLEEIRFYTSLDFCKSILGFSAELSYLEWSGQLGVLTHPFLSMELYLLCMLIPVVLAFSALLFRRDRWALFLSSSALISAFIAKGLNPPFGEVYHWLYFNFPFFGSIHSPNRWLMVTLFCYAVLAGFTIKGIQPQLKNTQALFSRKLKDNMNITALQKLSTLARVLLLFLLLSSAILPVSWIVIKSIQPWAPPIELLESYDWLAREAGDYRVVTIPYFQTRMKAFWEPTSERWYLNDLGVQSRLWHDKLVIDPSIDLSYAADFLRYTKSLVRENSTTYLMDVLGTFNVRYLILQNYSPMQTSGIPYLGHQFFLNKLGWPHEFTDLSPDFEHQFFLDQRGSKTVFTSGNSSILENQYWTPRFFTTGKYVIIVGGREAFWLLSMAECFALKEYGWFFADQVIQQQGKIFFLELLKGARALVFSNTGFMDLVLPLVDGAVRISPSDYAYPSSNASAHWITTNRLIDLGMPLMNQLSVTTSANNIMSIPFHADSDDSYDLWIHVLCGPKRGELTVWIDEALGGRVRPDASSYGMKWINLGRIELDEGAHELVLQNRKTMFYSSNDVDAIMLVKPSAMNATIEEMMNVLGDSMKRENFVVKTVVVAKDSSAVVNCDQQAFWSLYNPKYVRLNDSWEERPDEMSNASLKLELYRENRRSYSLIEHRFEPVQDWRGTRYLVFWFKGQGTGTDFSLDVYFKGMSSYASYAIRDVSSSWRPVVISLAAPPGTVDWSQVERIALSNSDKSITGTFYINRLVRAQKASMKIELEPVSKCASPLTFVEDKTFTYPVRTGALNVSYFGVDDVGVSRVLSYRQVNPTFYEVEVNASKPFYLMFSESYHPMWRAFVDGVEVESTPAYSFINSFPINRTGHLKITLEFTGQRYAAVGALISTASISITLIIVFFRRKKIIVVLHKRKNKLSSRLNVGKSE